MRYFIFLLALFGTLLGESLAQQEVVFDCSKMPCMPLPRTALAPSH